MRSFGDLSAARLAVLESVQEQSEVTSEKIRPVLPRNGWHAAIIELCLDRFQYCYFLNQSARNIFQTDLERRSSSTGYVFDGLPVRVSWGVGKMASLISDSDSKLDQFEHEIDLCRQQTEFGTEDPYEILARQWLRHSRDLRRRVEYYLQASMWVQWTVESLWQADRIAAHLLSEDSHYLSQYDGRAFSYLAHPPLFVAVMTAASMVEEVGAYTIKELEVDADPDMGDTRLSDVLNWISTYDLVPDEVDLAVLEDDLRSARNELAHSMMARSTTITIDSFGDYVDAVWSAINLTNYLAERLLGGVFTELDALSFTVPR